MKSKIYLGIVDFRRNLQLLRLAAGYAGSLIFGFFLTPTYSWTSGQGCPAPIFRQCFSDTGFAPSIESCVQEARSRFPGCQFSEPMNQFCQVNNLNQSGGPSVDCLFPSSNCGPPRVRNGTGTNFCPQGCELVWIPTRRRRTLDGHFILTSIYCRKTSNNPPAQSSAAGGGAN